MGYDVGKEGNVAEEKRTEEISEMKQEPSVSPEDMRYMKEAIRQAKKAAALGDVPIGCVIVYQDKIIGRGYNRRMADKTVLAHAEILAMKKACKKMGDWRLEDCTMYVTLEPCSHYGKTPPCADKIVEKKIGRVVVGALDPNPLVAGRGIEKIRNAGIPVITGILAERSIALNEVFMKYIVTKRPFVLLKAAMSLDGKIATADGESQWISCEASREEVHRLRHELTGIMAGIGTVLADDPMLNCRIPGGKQPVRIIVDSHLSIPETSKLVCSAKEFPLVVATLEKSDAAKKERLEAQGVQVIGVSADDGGHVDLNILMERLGEMKIDSILLEGGGRLAEGALKAEIVDKVQFYIAPILIGGEGAKTPVEGRGIAALSEAWHVSDWKAEMIGDDIKITGYIKERG